MAEDPYTNRELDEKFASVHKELENQNDERAEQFEATMKVLADIKEQTTKTNGSVAKVKEAQSFATGFMYGIGAFIVAVILPVLGYFAVLSIGNSTHIAAMGVQLKNLLK